MFSWLEEPPGRLFIVELYFLALGFNFGLGSVTQPSFLTIFSKQVALDDVYINTAILYSLISLICSIVTFKLVRSHFETQIAKYRSYDVPRNQLQNCIITLVLIGLLGPYFLKLIGERYLGAIIPMVASQISIAGLLAYFEYLERGLPANHFRILAVVIFIISSLQGLASGMLEGFVVPILMLAIVHISMKRRVSVLFAASAIMGVFLLNSVKHEFRKRAWYREDTQTFERRMHEWYNTISTFDFASLWTSSDGSVEGWRTSMGRFSLINRFAWVISKTPDSLPYLGGQTYEPFGYGFIPRFLWPGKPTVQGLNGILDRYYQMQYDNYDGPTTIGVGYIAESYANFGIVGLIAIPCLISALVTALAVVFDARRTRIGASIYLMAIIGILNGQGACAYILFGNLLQVLLACFLLASPFLRIRAPRLGATSG